MVVSAAAAVVDAAAVSNQSTYAVAGVDAAECVVVGGGDHAIEIVDVALHYLIVIFLPLLPLSSLPSLSSLSSLS